MASRKPVVARTNTKCCVQENWHSFSFWIDKWNVHTMYALGFRILPFPAKYLTIYTAWDWDRLLWFSTLVDLSLSFFIRCPPRNTQVDFECQVFQLEEDLLVHTSYACYPSLICQSIFSVQGFHSNIMCPHATPLSLLYHWHARASLAQQHN